jgi:PAS domain S-box-containing protein
MKKKMIKHFVLLNLIITLSFVAVFFSYDLISHTQDFLQNPFYSFSTPAEVIAVTLQLIVVLAVFNIMYYYFYKYKVNMYHIYDLIPQIILIHDLEGRIQYINKFAEKFFKYTLDEIKGRYVYEFAVKSERQLIMSNMKKAIEEQKSSWSNTYSFLSREAQVFSLVVTTTFYSKDLFLSSAYDYTELNVLREKDEKKSGFFWNMINSISTPIIYLDQDMSFSFINKPFSNVFGVQPQDLIGKKIVGVFNIEESEEILKKVNIVYKTGSPFDLRIKLKTIQGFKYFDVHISLHVNYSNNRGILITFIDVTKQLITQTSLKSDIKFTNSLKNISQICSHSGPSAIDETLKQSFNEVTKISDFDYFYILEVNGDIRLVLEKDDSGMFSTYGEIIEMSRSHKAFYNKFVSQDNTIVIENFAKAKRPELTKMEHFKKFGIQSVAEFSFPSTSSLHKKSVFGFASKTSSIINKQKLNYLTSASKIIFAAYQQSEFISDLLLSDETLNTLLDNTDIGIIISSESGDIYYSNDRIFQLAGFEFDDLMITVLLDKLVLPESHEERKSFAPTLKTEGTASSVFHVQQPGGKRMWVKIYSAKIDYEGSKAYLTTITDVTEFKEDKA